MNCLNHPDVVSVSSCTVCGVGLCVNCTKKYKKPICTGCANNKTKVKRIVVIKELLFTIILGVVVANLLKDSSYDYYNSMNHIPTPGEKKLDYVILFYIGASIIPGWKVLSSIKTNMIFILPIFTWIILPVFKLMFSLFIGPFVLPFRTINNIRKLL